MWLKTTQRRQPSGSVNTVTTTQARCTSQGGRDPGLRRSSLWATAVLNLAPRTWGASPVRNEAEVGHKRRAPVPVGAKDCAGRDVVTSANARLGAAKAAKNDEFYTQWADIEREVNAYLEYDPHVFFGKTLLLPCDDPEWSNFTKFFALHFTEYGLKKLISTSYAPDAKSSADHYAPTLFELGNPRFDETKTLTNGKKFVLTQDDINADGRVDIDDLQWDYLEGTGDFRSTEVTALRDEADVVITNPPFSLFREFITWLIEGNTSFAVVGSNNAITYAEVFPHIKDNKLWKGATANTTDMVFGIPKGTVVQDSDRAKAERMGYPSDENHDYTRLGNACWFTNIDHGRRHEPLRLMTMADNLRFNKRLTKKLDGQVSYERYDNFEAIDVPYADAIPSDFDGIMGVPITFLDRYNPEQFEIIGNGEGHLAAALGVAPLGPEFVGSQGRTKLGIASTKQAVFKRILIRRKDTP